MMRALIVIAACLFAGCVNVQDLSDRRAPDPEPTAQESIARPIPALPAAPEAEPTSCPSAMPLENAACGNVAWCSYPLDGASGLAAKCGCSLGHWLCLRVRDDHRANPVAVEAVPLTTASCTEGAVCEQGTKCRLGLERWCECTSSRRLRCVRPTH
jgi:hypothetical protein